MLVTSPVSCFNFRLIVLHKALNKTLLMTSFPVSFKITSKGSSRTVMQSEWQLSVFNPWCLRSVWLTIMPPDSQRNRGRSVEQLNSFVLTWCFCHQGYEITLGTHGFGKATWDSKLVAMLPNICLAIFIYYLSNILNSHSEAQRLDSVVVFL